MKVLTFDIEEWFHLLDHPETRDESSWDKFEFRLEDNLNRLFDLCFDTNSRATFFVLGWVAKKYPELVKMIDTMGFEVGCHSNNHQLVYELTPDQFKEDTRTAIDRLEQILGKKVTAYRAPGFSITQDTLWAFEILAELGITHDSSVFPAERAHGGFVGFPTKEPAVLSYKGKSIKELPITTTKLFGRDIVFGGGGYFRLFPYKYIHRWTADNDYVMTYMHPRDLDAGQPVVPGLSKVRKFKSYYGLKKAEEKMFQWLTDFDFVDITTFDKHCDWKTEIKL